MVVSNIWTYTTYPFTFVRLEFRRASNQTCQQPKSSSVYSWWRDWQQTLTKLEREKVKNMMKIAMNYLFRIKTLLAQQLFDNVSTTYGRLAIRKFYLRKLRLTNTYKIFFLIGPFSGIIYTYGYEISVCQLSIYLIMHVTNETVRLRKIIHPSPLLFWFLYPR